MAQPARTLPNSKKAPTERSARVSAMALANPAPSATPASAASTEKAARILAKSLFRQLKDSGYQNRDILTLSTELVSLITTDLRPTSDKSKA